MFKYILLFFIFSLAFAGLTKPRMHTNKISTPLPYKQNKLQNPTEHNNGNNSGVICLMFIKNNAKILLGAIYNKSCLFYSAEPENAFRYDTIRALYKPDGDGDPIGWIISYKGVYAQVFYPMVIPENAEKTAFNSALELPSKIADKKMLKMAKYGTGKLMGNVIDLFIPTNDTPNTRTELLEKRVLILENKLSEEIARRKLDRMEQQDLNEQYNEEIAKLREEIRQKSEALAAKEGKIDDLYRELEHYEKKKKDAATREYLEHGGGGRELSRGELDAQRAGEERRQHERNRERNDPSYTPTRHAAK